MRLSAMMAGPMYFCAGLIVAQGLAGIPTLGGGGVVLVVFGSLLWITTFMVRQDTIKQDAIAELNAQLEESAAGTEQHL